MEKQWGGNGGGEFKAFKYLGEGHASECAAGERLRNGQGRHAEWMSRKDGQIEVERGRLVWELLARPSLEHVASRDMVAWREDSK